MEQIKFRGLSTNGEWVYGYYAYTSIFSNRNDYYKHIIITKNDYKEIDEGTQSMFTGLYDNNGKEIYEGDIVNIIDGRVDVNGKKVSGFDDTTKRLRENGPVIDKAVITYNNDYAWVEILGNKQIYRNGEYRLEIIGNIYENPNLINNK